MKPLGVFLLATLLAVPVCHAADPVPEALSSKLKSLAGPSSKDCGSVSLHESPDAAISCAQEAASSGKAYRLAVEFQGPDSVAWQGAARDEQGKLWALFYESDVLGGSQAGTTLSVVHCRDILFASQDNDVIECKPIVGGP